MDIKTAQILGKLEHAKSLQTAEDKLVAKTRRETTKRCWRDLLKFNSRPKEIDDAIFISSYDVGMLKKKWGIK